MMQKKILRPDRLRQVPAQFSWVDQRLVRENFLRYADPAAWALYLVLVTVADVQGLSYYSERRQVSSLSPFFVSTHEKATTFSNRRASSMFTPPSSATIWQPSGLLPQYPRRG